MSTRLIAEEDLHAFIDGELEGERRAAAEAAIDADENLRRQAAGFRADKERLSRLHADLLREPVPGEWIALIESRASPRRRPLSREIAALAAAVLLVIGGVFAYRQLGPREEPIIEEALAARTGSTVANEAVAVGPPVGATVASRVVSTALNMRLKAPDLTAMGYRLSGVRVYSDVPGGKAVEILYRKDGNRVFALYLRHPNGEPRFDQFRLGRLRICIWQDDVLGTVMTGEMSAAEMQRLASLAYTGLSS